LLFHKNPRRRFIPAWFLWLTLGLIVVGVLAYELRTSALQARLLSSHAARLSYEVGSSPSPRIAFPAMGPFDQRRGYTRLPVFLDNLTARGYAVSRQSAMSPELVRLIGWGVSPPYREPVATGLMIRGADGTFLYDATPADHLFFHRFEDIPPLLVKTLLFMENRELEESSAPRHNPVIEWDRLAKAGLLYAGHKLGLALPIQGGSTLATQLDKVPSFTAGADHFSG